MWTCTRDANGFRLTTLNVNKANCELVFETTGKLAEHNRGAEVAFVALRYSYNAKLTPRQAKIPRIAPGWQQGVPSEVEVIRAEDEWRNDRFHRVLDVVRLRPNFKAARQLRPRIHLSWTT